MTDYIEAVIELDKLMKDLKFCLLDSRFQEARNTVARIRLTASQLDEQIVKQVPETVK